jgi:uncharacterized membrane protein YphA (DoxX/SURF4 family)
MLLRRIARPLLATTFIVDGVNTLLHPEPLAKDLANNPIATKISTDPARPVQVIAASQISGGILLAFGKVPRISALILAAASLPVLLTQQDFWAEQDPDRRSAKRVGFLKDAGLLGGLMLATADTEGKPSLGWRGKRAAHTAAQTISATLPLSSPSTRENVAQYAHDAAETGRVLADHTRDDLAGLLDTAREYGPKWADAAREHAADIATHLADTVRENGPALADTVHDRGADLAEIARRRGTGLFETAKDRGAELAETARHRVTG